MKYTVRKFVMKHNGWEIGNLKLETARCRGFLWTGSQVGYGKKTKLELGLGGPLAVEFLYVLCPTLGACLQARANPE